MLFNQEGCPCLLGEKMYEHTAMLTETVEVLQVFRARHASIYKPNQAKWNPTLVQYLCIEELNTCVTRILRNVNKSPRRIVLPHLKWSCWLISRFYLCIGCGVSTCCFAMAFRMPGLIRNVISEIIHLQTELWNSNSDVFVVLFCFCVCCSI